MLDPMVTHLIKSYTNYWGNAGKTGSINASSLNCNKTRQPSLMNPCAKTFRATQLLCSQCAWRLILCVNPRHPLILKTKLSDATRRDTATTYPRPVPCFRSAKSIPELQTLHAPRPTEHVLVITPCLPPNTPSAPWSRRDT